MRIVLGSSGNVALSEPSFWAIQCTLIWNPKHCDIPANCRADELARAGALPEFFSIDLGMPVTSFKLAIELKFSRDANLSWINEESSSTAFLTWRSMDRKGTNQLLCSGRGRHAERMRLPFNNFCREYSSAEKQETVIHFLCQCPSLARCRFRLFGSPALVSFTDLSSSI